MSFSSKFGWKEDDATELFGNGYIRKLQAGFGINLQFFRNVSKIWAVFEVAQRPKLLILRHF